MIEKIDLKKIERKVYLTYHQDGIWDIFIGMAFLSVGILVAVNLTSFVGIYPAVIAGMILFLIKAKKSFTQSRLGHIEPSDKWRIKEKKNLMILQIVGFLSVVAGIINFVAFSGRADWQISIRDLGLIPFGVVCSTIIFIVGSLLGMKRFLFYAVLILGFFIVGHYADTPFYAYFILLGLIITICGIIVLVRFIRRYPRPERAVIDDRE